MSDIKHQPKTPLPWTFNEKPKDWEGDPSYEVGIEVTYGFNSIMGDQLYYPNAPEKEDARYATHAANAYPKLIAALRNANRAIYAAGAPLGSGNYFAIREALVAILRELGEEA